MASLPTLLAQDLENLIEKAVDPSKANYAVITGTQVNSLCNYSQCMRQDRPSIFRPFSCPPRCNAMPFIVACRE